MKLEISTPSGVDARRMLLAHSARALGIATADDLRDYFRIPAPDVQEPIAQLIEEGTVVPVRVQGWRQQAYLYKNAGPAVRSPDRPCYRLSTRSSGIVREQKDCLVSVTGSKSIPPPINVSMGITFFLFCWMAHWWRGST